MRVNLAKAKSLLIAARRDNLATKSIPLTPSLAPTIIRNVYESFRMLGEVLLVLEGVSSSSHDSQIRMLVDLNVPTSRPLQALHLLKTLRHKINYDGYAATVAEAEDALNLSEVAFDALATRVAQILDN